MLTEHGVRAELMRSDKSSPPSVWVPAQHYVRAMDLMARINETGPSPCDVCPDEAQGRFEVCWTCADALDHRSTQRRAR
jgi:hypothetical protein